MVWFQNCNFLGDERTAGAHAVTETLADLAQEWKEFSWEDVRLLISAAKVDKRKVLLKTIDKIGAVESFDAWSDGRPRLGGPGRGVGAAGASRDGRRRFPTKPWPS